MEKIFIDKNINVSKGFEAEQKLTEKNDLHYFDEKDGVKKVDINRWLEAQQYESKTWLEVARGVNDDRNFDHSKNLNNYKLVPSLISHRCLNIIELGCGPFTNMRLLLPHISNICSIDLLDPLINQYMLSQPNCTFKNKTLNFINPVNTFNSPIEQFNPTKKYDIVLMINVLEHCYDTDLIFDKIYNMLNENGLFIFGDIFIKDDYNEEWNKNVYDTGHPIKLSESYLNTKLDKYKIEFENKIDENERVVHYYMLKKK